jgi:hypothetical protein
MRSLLFGTALLALAGSASSQNIFYVDDATGDDNDSGLSYALAKKTIQAAVDAASPFDTVNVLPGTYPENVFVDFELRLEGRPGATVVPGNGAGLTLDATLNQLTSFTQVKNFVIQGNGLTNPNGSTGVSVVGGKEASPRIEHNQILDCVAGVDVDGSGEEGIVHRPLIRYNRITSTTGVPAALQYGIRLRAFDAASLEAVIHANRISFFEYGILSRGQSSRPSIRCDFIWRCEWGILLKEHTEARVTNETIAYGAPASVVPFVYGIQVEALSTLHLANSIVWIPNGTNYTGNDLDGLIQTIINTFDEDCDPGTLCANPNLVDPANGDLRIDRTSPAIGAGDSLYVWPAPTGTVPVDHDVFGGPRITDGLRKGKMWVDCGAHEYNPTDLDVAILGVGAGEPMIDTERGVSLTFRITGLVGDTGYFWYAPKSSDLNMMMNPLGNLLAYVDAGNPPQVVTLTPLGPVHAAGSVTVPLACCDPSLIEAELSFQAACLSTATTPMTLALGPAVETGVLGNMTRRIEVEVNAQP